MIPGRTHGESRSGLAFCAAVLLLLAHAGGATLAGAQVGAEPAAPAATFGETLDIHLVTLDIVAVDRSGELVTDLRPEEIEVLEDGERVELTSFDPPAPVDLLRGDRTERRSRPAARDAKRPGGPPAAKLVVFVDNVHIGPGSRERFVGELWAFLEEEVGSETEVLVASLGQGLALLTDFTTDRAEIRGALEAGLRAPALQIMADQSERQAIRTLHQMQANAVEQLGKRGEDFEQVCGPRLGTLAEQLASAERDRTASAVAALRFLVATLGGVEGRKALLHVSDGVPLIPGQPIIEYVVSLCDGSGAQEGVQYATEALPGSDRHAFLDPAALRMSISSLSVQEDLARVTELATANRVRLFPFQTSAGSAGGAEAGDGVGKMQTGFGRFLEARNQQDTLFYLAAETGGRAFLTGSGFAEDLETLHQHLTATYSLSYRSPAARDGSRHRVAVRTTRPGLRILHPSHRVSKTMADEIADRLLAALHHGATHPPQGARLELVARSAGVPPTALRLALPTAAVTLPMPDGGRWGMLEIYVTTLDAAGRSPGIRKQVHPVQMPPGVDPPPSVVVVVDMGGELASHQVAVAVHDQLQGSVWTLTRAAARDR